MMPDRSSGMSRSELAQYLRNRPALKRRVNQFLDYCATGRTPADEKDSPVSDTYHTYPGGDLIQHDTNGDDCLCGPTLTAVERDDGSYGWHLLHHSLDGREMHESPATPGENR